jgi:hypothetical protein
MRSMDDAYAMVIGIAAYAHVAPLPESVRHDAADVYDLLVDPGLGGYHPDNAVALFDAAASRSGILAGLADLASRAAPDSAVLLYVSAHGGLVESGPDAGEYLLPVDTAEFSASGLARTAISGAEFGAALAAIPARKVLVVFDCCHAGGIGAVKGAGPLVTGLPESYYERLAAGRGRVILASCRDSESSYVLRSARNSLFTEHLLAGLRGGIPTEDGLVRVFDLFEYVQPRVTADQPEQHPVFKAELEENFAVALAPAGGGATVSTDEDGFRYDAFVSYAEREPDESWVWDVLVPRLEAAGLRVAVSGASGDPGVPTVVNAERGIRQAKRTVVVLSPAYLEDGTGEFENVLAQSLDVQEGSYRVLPVRREAIDERRLPARLGMLSSLDLSRPARAPREFDRLVGALRAPLPRR